MAEIEILENAVRDREYTEGEKAVFTFIQEHISWEEVLKSDQRWETFYHFSPMRQSLFNWYTFEKESCLLELGCETGILTQHFCESCGNVISADRDVKYAQAAYERNIHCPNLTVYAGDVRERLRDKRFDYVVLQPDYYREDLRDFLTYAQNVLKPCGHLLLVVKNKLGVDVLCGKTNGTETPYAAFNVLDNEYLSRREVINRLKETEFQKCKFFYPLPDAIVPQEIYSDAYMPHEKRTDRILNYYPQKQTMLISPESLSREVISNKMLDNCANSFLLDCSVQADPSEVCYAALSTDREKSAAYATKIYQGAYVEKTALYPEGKTGVLQLAANARELEGRGILTVAQEADVDGRTLRMPYVSEELLIQRISGVYGEQERLQDIFDVLYQAILNSSEHISSDENCMRNHAPGADWGVILEKAYIDMIPLNCFWNDGELLFFDQEYTRTKCPAKYVMFRALRYTFLSLDGEGKTFDLDSWRRRYGMEELWDIFLLEEDKFIFKNRNHELYRNFYQWTQLEPQSILGNVDRLMQKETAGAGSWEICDGIECFFQNMFCDRESDECGSWRWSCGAAAEILLQSGEEAIKKYELEFEIVLSDPAHVKRAEIYIDDKYWGQFIVPNKIVVPLQMGKKAQKKVTIMGDFQEKTFPGDSRKLYFQFRNYSIREEPAYVSKLIRDVREVQVDILKSLQTVCEKYGLRYFAMYGTLLGIVRNQDYIPWDDDIDIAMPREDYDRLLGLAEKEHVFESTLFLQNMYSDSGCFFGGYSKLRKNGTLGITRANRRQNCHNGIWIDIFPIDNRVHDMSKLYRQHREIRFYQRLLFHKVYGRNGMYTEYNSWSWGYFCAASVLRYDFLCRKLDRAIQRFDGEGTAKQSIFARIMPLASIPAFPRECFGRNGTGQFHGMEVNIPIVVEECLNVCWGYNYMLYPGEELRKPHADVEYYLKED